ncbi:MAG: nucleotidyltransferase family protein [Actinomycetota bacterium]
MTASPPSLVQRIAAFGAIDRPPIDVAGLTASEWGGFKGAIRNQRLTGLAMAMVEAGCLEVGDLQRAELVELQRQAMLGALGLEAILLRTGRALDRAGIDFVVLKGPAVAHCFYPDPSWRPFGDLDLLVHGDDFARASDVLQEEGFDRSLPEPRQGWDRDFGKAALHADAGGAQIDLHQRLVVGPFGLWIDLDDLLVDARPFEVGGRTFRRLGESPMFLHACLHASLGWHPTLLLPLRDVSEVGRNQEIDWNDVERLARKWRVSCVLEHTMRTLTQTLQVPPPAGVAGIGERVLPTRLERRALSAYTTDRRRRGGTAILMLVAIPGVFPKLRYIIDLLFPRRQFLAARALPGQRPSYLRRWKQPLRWLHGSHR